MNVKQKDRLKTRSIAFARPLIDEKEVEAVVEVLNNPILVHGPKAEQFEADFSSFTGASNAVTMSSCTAGMHLAYFNWGLKSGDEVIVPAQTHVATAHAVELTGARPVFVDADIKTGNIDVEKIEEAITKKTKAIAVVHFLGLPVNMERVMEIAKKYNLYVLEDCALALGAYFKGIHVGLWGDAGCFSFYPVKHITTAEGGMLITKHEELAAQIRHKRAFGIDRHQGERTIPGVYDVNDLGLNYRMNEIQSVLGVEQMKKLQGFLERRKRNASVLREGLEELPGIEQFSFSGGDYESSAYCHSILLDEKRVEKRFEIIKSLNERGVGTSIYYPRAVPHFSYYKNKYGYTNDSYPVAAAISGRSIALPVGPHLDSEDMEYIVGVIKEVL